MKSCIMNSGEKRMNETFRATYQKGVLVPLQDPRLREKQVVHLQVVPARVKISAAVARRVVNRFLLDEVSYLMGAEQPSLAETGRLVWRVPVSLTSPERGILGQVGAIDVDAETGELLLSERTITEITNHARNLAESNASPATPSI
jgi:hypothetical protein